MEVIIVFVVAFIGLAVVARIGLSNATRERRAMSGHRQTLETISKVADAPVADRDVRTFKVEPLRPVRLDLSKLDDLTDPDLIRITSPLASDDEPPVVEDPAADTDQDHDTGRSRTHASSEGDATVAHDTFLDRDDREDPASVPEREAIDSGLVFGDEGLIDTSPGESELTTQLIAAGEVGPSLLTQSMATVESPLAQDEVDEKGSADEQGSTEEFGRGQHRVYSSGRRGVPLSAMAVGAGAIAVLLGVGFFVLGRNTSATVVPPSSTNQTQTTTPSKTSSTGSQPASSTKKKTGTGGSSTTKQAKSTTGGNGASGNSSSASPTSYTPVSSNASYATYDIPGGAKTIVVSASQPCWVADSDSANGALLWDETLPAGGSYTISSTAASLWIKVGNAHEFQMQVNGVPVSFSAPPGVYAFNLVATSGQSPA